MFALSTQLHQHSRQTLNTMAALMDDPGEKSLDKLLSTLTTVLHPKTYVFTSIDTPRDLPPLSEIQLLFRETEAVTVIITKDYAEERCINYFFPCNMITLNVTSSLEAVGFMAAIATRLAKLGMGVNPVSGFYHDHLFVPEDRAQEAVAELRKLAEEKNQELV